MTQNSRLAVSIHILAYLAHRAGRDVSSTEIAGSVATHPVVIRRLLSVLVRAGLVQGRKGAAGGFRLAAAPEHITLHTIYRAVDPQPNLGLKNFSPNHRCPVGAKIEKVLHEIMVRAQAALETELARVTLADVGNQLSAICPGKARPATEA